MDKSSDAVTIRSLHCVIPSIIFSLDQATSCVDPRAPKYTPLWLMNNTHICSNECRYSQSRKYQSHRKVRVRQDEILGGWGVNVAVLTGIIG